MQSQAATVKEYLDQLPGDRRAVMRAVRACIRKNLPRGFQEDMGKCCLRFRSLDDLALDVIGESLRGIRSVEAYVADYERQIAEARSKSPRKRASPPATANARSAKASGKGG